MSTQRIENVAALKEAIPAFTNEQLVEEAQFTFSYYGNAVHNGQVQRQDDAIERFKVVKREIERRLGAAGVQETDSVRRPVRESSADADTSASKADELDGAGAAREITPGEGWYLLAEGEVLQPGDGFIHPDHRGWIDYACRPDAFRGDNEEVHSGWSWRRRVAEMSIAG